MSDNPLKLKRIDHVEFYTGNAKQAAYYYRQAFGFSQFAYSGLETGVRDASSYALRQGKANFVFTSPLSIDHPSTEHVRRHGDGVHDIAFEVDDVDSAFEYVVSRGAVVGVALDAWMITPGWKRGKTTPQSANLHLANLVDHIDHYCQLAGNARHIGIGSDLDGTFGTEQTPQDVSSIADLQRFPDLLSARGFSQSDIEGVMSGNFLGLLRRALSPSPSNDASKRA